MITKRWKISLLKKGKRVTIFAMTTDVMVDTDLDGDMERSLIYRARQYHRHPQTEDQNHRDLAIGAIMAHAQEPLFDRTDAHIEPTSSVPDGEPVAYVGGGRNGSLVPLWEEEPFE